MPLLDVDQLTIAYHTRSGPVTAVDNVSFQLEKGRFLGIVGESGCGKTTIGMSLLGLLPENGFIRSGRILFEGTDLLKLSKKELQAIRWKKISMIFQAAMNALNPVQRVGDQIIEAIRIHNPAFSNEKILQDVKQLYDLVDIPEERMFDYPHQYSGGMKQRAIIAMALSCRPDLVIADEPTTALDVIVQDQIIRKIKDIQEKMGIAGIFISHDIGVVAEACHDIMVMYRGKIVEYGKREEVFVSPAHPYTLALLSSHLTIDGVFDFHGDEAGTVCDFSPAVSPAICIYSDNCRRAEAACFAEAPKWREITPTHKALCRLCGKND
ncbi:MAG: ABC transporter ATP-binding protein [Desulfosalsimonadaceae bacterium]